LSRGRQTGRRQKDCQEADRLAVSKKIVKRQTDWQIAERLSRGRQTAEDRKIVRGRQAGIIQTD
jgi:hypothetical protein